MVMGREPQIIHIQQIMALSKKYIKMGKVCESYHIPFITGIRIECTNPGTRFEYFREKKQEKKKISL